jgi:tRNA threonylcarbamoyladenosine biosynthesis protein TsaB
MANFLGIDASTECCSAALLLDDKIFEKSQISPQGHTKLLLPMVDELLKEQNIKLEDLEAIVCGKGPGSFTGVRIGVSMAQGLAFGAEKKLIGINDLQALAYRAIEDTNIKNAIVAIDARMGEVYLGIYSFDEKLIPLIDECVVKPEDAIEKIKEVISDKQFAYCGTGFKTYEQIMENFEGVIRAPIDLPLASSLLKIANIQGESLEPEEVLPLYIRDNVAWKKVNEQ